MPDFVGIDVSPSEGQSILTTERSGRDLASRMELPNTCPKMANLYSAQKKSGVER